MERLSLMSPKEVDLRVQGFPERYKRDWQEWTTALAKGGSVVPTEFRRTLVKWQAVRSNVKGRRVRQLAAVGGHPGPFIDELLSEAATHLATLTSFDVRQAPTLSTDERRALLELWNIFGCLPTVGSAGCVGITKAILLLTGGRVGPALDSKVRSALGVKEPREPNDWIRVLQLVGADVCAFEEQHGAKVEDIIEETWQPAGVGRVYDMVFGPRG